MGEFFLFIRLKTRPKYFLTAKIIWLNQNHKQLNGMRNIQNSIKELSERNAIKIIKQDVPKNVQLKAKGIETELFFAF